MRIKNATQQLNLGLISIWQFLLRCSYVTEGYEQRQRIWALRNNDEMADEGQIEHFEQLPPDELPLEVELNVGDPPARRPWELPLEERVDVADPPAESSVCMVCMVVTINGTAAEYIILPCGHAWVCASCVERLEVPNSVCPLCRIPNISFQRIFFS